LQRIDFVLPEMSASTNDLLITWTATGGFTNVVQATADPCNTFSDSNPRLMMPGSGTTNTYLDVGSLTNCPARFYRIRLAE